MKESLNILILGNGGRERAMVAKIAESPRCANLYCNAPDSPGVLAAPEDAMDFKAIAEFCLNKDINMLLIGPAMPIVGGIKDYLNDYPGLEALRVIAPSQEAARLEGSKEFAKEFMSEAGIPSPRFMPVDADTLAEGLSFLDSLPGPYVLKADGLANGKGVIITPNLPEAKDALEDMINGLFGSASSKVLIEEYIEGRECSVIIATDGDDFLTLPIARDYKRHGDDDCGPNTPGMGAYSPVSFADETFLKKVEKRIITPTLRSLREMETDYQGFLYFGIMELDGEPILIEYNVRPGDPETQTIMPRIASDFVEVLEGIADRTIALKHMQFHNFASASIVIEDDGRRVNTVTAIGETPTQAAQKAYNLINVDNLKKPYFRKDIARETSE